MRSAGNWGRGSCGRYRTGDRRTGAFAFALAIKSVRDRRLARRLHGRWIRENVTKLRQLPYPELRVHITEKRPREVGTKSKSVLGETFEGACNEVLGAGAVLECRTIGRDR